MKRFFLTAILALVLVLPAVAGGTEQGVAPLDIFGTLLPLGVVGMVVNAANLAAMFKSFNALFNKAFAAAQPQYPKIAMTVPSTTRSNNYSWMALLSGMREWIGDRQVQNLKTYIYEILNKTWEHTIRVLREDIEDDQYGVYAPIAEHQGSLVPSHHDDIVFGLLNDGFTKLAFDGKAFFATDHGFGSNKATYPLTHENYGKARAALGKIKKADGSPFYTGAEKITLVTGSALEATALTILNAEYISVSSGSTQNNIWKGSADYLKSARISSDTAWFLCVEFQGLKPLVFQMRRPAQFKQLTSPDSEQVQNTNEFQFGVDGRWNAGYGLPQLAFGSTGAS